MKSILPHQTEAFERLSAIANAFFEGNWRDLPLLPRFAPLLSGPTGSGKSHLARELASSMGVDFFELTCSAWMLLGCSNNRGATVTWPNIAQFCEQHSSGVIFIDEIDKLNGTSDWSNFLRMEVFALLDRQTPLNLRCESEDDSPKCDLHLARARLKENMCLVGAGAFQSRWEETKRGQIGFSDTESESTLSFANCTRDLPAEIAYRFSQILPIRPLRQEDYRELLNNLVERLPENLQEDVKSLGMQTLKQAVAEQRGCRWGQELVEMALMKQPPRKKVLDSPVVHYQCGF